MKRNNACFKPIRLSFALQRSSLFTMIAIKACSQHRLGWIHSADNLISFTFKEQYICVCWYLIFHSLFTTENDHNFTFNLTFIKSPKYLLCKLFGIKPPTTNEKTLWGKDVLHLSYHFTTLTIGHQLGMINFLFRPTKFLVITLCSL